LNLQVGANAGQAIDISTMGISTKSLNIDDVDISLNYDIAIVKFDEALNLIDTNRGQIGAQMNRLEMASAVASNTSENLSTARSRILDADIASETSALTKQNIIQQASVSMLSQAGIAPQLALQLLG
jgi:flagellin